MAGLLGSCGLMRPCPGFVVALPLRGRPGRLGPGGEAIRGARAGPLMPFRNGWHAGLNVLWALRGKLGRLLHSHCFSIIPLLLLMPRPCFPLVCSMVGTMHCRKDYSSGLDGPGDAANQCLLTVISCRPAAQLSDFVGAHRDWEEPSSRDMSHEPLIV